MRKDAGAAQNGCQPCLCVFRTTLHPKVGTSTWKVGTIHVKNSFPMRNLRTSKWTRHTSRLKVQSSKTNRSTRNVNLHINKVKNHFCNRNRRTISANRGNRWKETRASKTNLPIPNRARRVSKRNSTILLLNSTNPLPTPSIPSAKRTVNR